jgi:hypothetical protein
MKTQSAMPAPTGNATSISKRRGIAAKAMTRIGCAAGLGGE